MADISQTRHPRNVPGPFYTTGECMACGAPEDEAPDLLAALDDGNDETFFVRQPMTPEEMERACRAAEVCCVNSVRYGGTDPTVIRRLGNRAEYCDHLLPSGPIRFWWETEEQWREVQQQRRPWWALWRRS